MMKLIKRWVLPKLDSMKIIKMGEEDQWRIYKEMRVIPRIKELFELNIQLSDKQYRETNIEAFRGVAKCLEEIVDNMDRATEVLNSIEEKRKKDVIDVTPGGYKPTTM